jgi:hypothetical protein
MIIGKSKNLTVAPDTISQYRMSGSMTETPKRIQVTGELVEAARAQSAAAGHENDAAATGGGENAQGQQGGHEQAGGEGGKQ